MGLRSMWLLRKYLCKDDNCLQKALSWELIYSPTPPHPARAPMCWHTYIRGFLFRLVWSLFQKATSFAFLRTCPPSEPSWVPGQVWQHFAMVVRCECVN